MTFEKAVAFCDNLEESGFDDWRLPELHEIRTLADKCVKEENPDFCTATDSCEWNSCEEMLCGKCEKYEDLVDFGSFWTNTKTLDGKILLWVLTVEEETVNRFVKPTVTNKTRCVRNKEE